MDAPFIDWISCSQYMGEGTPECVGALRFALDDQGVAEVETGCGRQLKGSFETSVRVTSHKGWVRFSGNPARWGRPDNLFGYDLDRSMEVVNSILAGLGIPPFTRGVPLHDCAHSSIELDAWSGVTFSEIHVTRNFETGSDLMARMAIRAYAARSAAYMRKGVHGDETVCWASTRRRVKAYRKGAEMAKHAKLSPWGEWAYQRGVIRHEVEIKRRILSETGYRHWGNLTMGKLISLFDKETEVLQRADCSLDPLAIESVPTSTRLTYAAWLKGEDVRSIMSRSAFYRHRKVLSEVASVDIAEVRNTGAQIMPMIRRVTLTPASPPAGYWQHAA